MNDALISIKPQFVRKILSGEKTVEVRSRAIALSPDTRLWIYSTLPVGRIEAVAIVDSVKTGAPQYIWNRFRAKIGISVSEFEEYVEESDQVSAIALVKARRVERPLTLAYLRIVVPGFHPPQFLKYLDPSDLLLRILVSHSCVSRGNLVESSSKP